VARAAVFPRHLGAAGDAGGEFFLHYIDGVTRKGFHLGAKGLGGFEGVGFLLCSQSGLGLDKEAAGLGEHGLIARIGGPSVGEQAAQGEVGVGEASSLVFGEGLAEPGIGQSGVEAGGLGKVGEPGGGFAQGHFGGGEAIERPGIAGFEFEGAELETLGQRGLFETGVNIAQDHETPGVVGGEFERVDQGVLGGVETAELHLAHGKFAVGGGEGGLELQDALVKFGGAGEIAFAGAFGGALGKASGLVGFGGLGWLHLDTNVVASQRNRNRAEEGEVFTQTRGDLVGRAGKIQAGDQQAEVRKRNRQMHERGNGVFRPKPRQACSGQETQPTPASLKSRTILAASSDADGILPNEAGEAFKSFVRADKDGTVFDREGGEPGVVEVVAGEGEVRNEFLQDSPVRFSRRQPERAGIGPEVFSPEAQDLPDVQCTNLWMGGNAQE
jgi:hypothetical protein